VKHVGSNQGLADRESGDGPGYPSQGS